MRLYVSGVFVIEILFEDNHLLAANKPSGMLTQSSGTEEESLEDQLRLWIKERDHKPGNVFLFALHRLDRGASGVVLFAKSQKSLSRMTQAFRERTTKKIYWALVDGRVPQDQGSLEHYLIHGDRVAEVVGESHPNGKHSLLHYKKLKEQEGITLLEIELVTGRYHQIRAQWGVIGCPLLGDTKYGSKSPFQGVALHHRSFTFIHPTTKEQIEVVAPAKKAFFYQPPLPPKR
jgi:23S rRNA pseudouridine1911/1915/1917 synthase